MNINPNPDPADYLSFYTREQAEATLHEFLTRCPLSWQKKAHHPMMDLLVQSRPDHVPMAPRALNALVIATAVDIYNLRGLEAFVFVIFALAYRKVYGDVDPRVYASLITAATRPDTIVPLGIMALADDLLSGTDNQPRNDSGQDIGLAS